jgi:hypothetical protein
MDGLIPRKTRRSEPLFEPRSSRLFSQLERQLSLGDRGDSISPSGPSTSTEGAVKHKEYIMQGKNISYSLEMRELFIMKLTHWV